MQTNRSFILLFAVFLLCGLAVRGQKAAPVITLRLDEQGHAVPSGLYGLMTEEINYSYDGGLYGELIRNRAFKDNPMRPAHWALVEEGGALGKMTLDRQQPINDALTVCLRLDVQHLGSRIGIADSGYWGIPVRSNTSYTATFYAKASRPGALTISIESNDGKMVYAKTQTDNIGRGWQRYRLTLNTDGDVTPTADTRFVIAAADTGTYWFNLVSLFPPTYHNTPNGNRPDIMQLLADMKPSFLRFPGGNYLEGDLFNSRFDWKKTVGALDQRPGHPSPWGYRSTDGMGLYEYLMWCEDLHMDPLLAVFAGYTLRGDYFDDSVFLKPFVDEALDEIEYVMGDASTQWGALRARDGHPAPFPLHYIEIGNEDGFDRAGTYGKRYAQFARAIRNRYPQLKLISTTGGKNDWLSARNPLPAENVDVIDEHFYRSSIEMQDMATLYDSADRRGPRIFVGEWASREGFPTTNLNAALGDAAFLTGLERNSDLVTMSCYAPLFVNVNPGGMQWKSDLIGYNTLSSYGSPSYYVQKMFSEYLGDRVVKVEAAGLPTQVKRPNTQDSARGVPPKTIPAMFFSATKDTRTGALYLKVVNATSVIQNLQINLKGAIKVTTRGTVTTIGSDNPENTNTIDEPKRLVPVTSEINGLGRSFRHGFPPYSVTVVQLQVK